MELDGRDAAGADIPARAGEHDLFPYYQSGQYTNVIYTAQTQKFGRTFGTLLLWRPHLPCRQLTDAGRKNTEEMGDEPGKQSVGSG